MAHKTPIDKIQIIPINEEKTIIPLVEQLNGLIDRYNAIYGLYTKTMFMSDSDIHKSIERVLINIENAIEALCLRLAETRFLIKTDAQKPEHTIEH